MDKIQLMVDPRAASHYKALQMKAKLENLVKEYGTIAIIVYLGIMGITIGGFIAAVQLGFKTEGISGGLGLLGATWVFLKVTQIGRIALTVIITPIVARIMHSKKSDGPTT